MTFPILMVLWLLLMKDLPWTPVWGTVLLQVGLEEPEGQEELEGQEEPEDLEAQVGAHLHLVDTKDKLKLMFHILDSTTTMPILTAPMLVQPQGQMILIDASLSVTIVMEFLCTASARIATT